MATSHLVLAVSGVDEGVNERGGQVGAGRVHLLRSPVPPPRNAPGFRQVALVDVLGRLVAIDVSVRKHKRCGSDEC